MTERILQCMDCQERPATDDDVICAECTIRKPIPCESGCGRLVENPRGEWDLCATCDEEFQRGEAEADVRSAVDVLGFDSVLRILREIAESGAGFARTRRDQAYTELAAELRRALRVTEGV
jgi:hypothetical protein